MVISKPLELIPSLITGKEQKTHKDKYLKLPRNVERVILQPLQVDCPRLKSLNKGPTGNILIPINFTHQCTNASDFFDG